MGPCLFPCTTWAAPLTASFKATLKVELLTFQCSIHVGRAPIFTFQAEPLNLQLHSCPLDRVVHNMARAVISLLFQCVAVRLHTYAMLQDFMALQRTRVCFFVRVFLRGGQLTHSVIDVCFELHPGFLLLWNVHPRRAAAVADTRSCRPVLWVPKHPRFLLAHRSPSVSGRVTEGGDLKSNCLHPREHRNHPSLL